MEIALHEDGERLVVAPTGELDLSNVAALEAAWRSAAVKSQAVVIDLSGLTFMDSTGLRALLEADAAARSNGFTLALREGRPEVQRIFEITEVLACFRWT